MATTQANQNTTPWTEELTNELKRLHARGAGLGEIARMLDMTRGQVIGKANRLGLKDMDRPKALQRTPRRSLSPKRPNKVPVLRADPEPAVFVRVLGPVRFIDRPQTRCSFIADDPKAVPIAQLMCCGEQVKPGSPYCAWHRTVTHQHYDMMVRSAIYVPNKPARAA